MKKLFTLFFLVSLLSFSSVAKIFRIGYPGTPVSGVDTNITGAMAAASSTVRDTIQLYEQYWTSSATITVTKALVFIGYGYFLNANLGLQSVPNIYDVNAISFTFNSGSSGSVVQGVYCGSSTINASDITFNRCRINGTITLANSSSSSLLKNITISACFFDNTAWPCIAESASTAISSLIVVNNIINGGYPGGYRYGCCAYYGAEPAIKLGNSSGLFANNVIWSNGSAPTFSSFMINNNIFWCPNPSIQSNVFKYNLFQNANSTPTISGVGNQFGVNMAIVFVGNGAALSVDSLALLKTSSPAKNAGRSISDTTVITDCGVFGGEPGDIYRLSGIPPVPAIYKLTAPAQSATTSPYNITISVRSNN